MEIRRNPDREALIQAGVNNSPFYKYLGMQVVGFSDTGSILEMEVRPEHKNVWGIMHGGVLGSLIDSACGTSIGPVLEPDETIVTLDLRVQYLAPVKDGRITARGRVIYRNRRFGIAEADVYDQSGNLMARGSTIHTVIRRG